VLADAAREFLVQQIVHDCYARSATKACWAPVHHPFPTLYGVAGHRAAGGAHDSHGRWSRLDRCRFVYFLWRTTNEV
jgi:hypothetical protein